MLSDLAVSYKQLFNYLDVDTIVAFELKLSVFKSAASEYS